MILKKVRELEKNTRFRDQNQVKKDGFVGFGASELSASEKQKVPGAASDTEEWGKGVFSGP